LFERACRDAGHHRALFLNKLWLYYIYRDLCSWTPIFAHFVSHWTCEPPFSKVPVMQNWSGFYFSFVYIWFDRASKADHEYIVFISIWPISGRKKCNTLECLKKHHFSFVNRNCQIFIPVILWTFWEYYILNQHEKLSTKMLFD